MAMATDLVTMTMGFFSLFVFFFSFVYVSNSEFSSIPGINFGQVGNNLPLLSKSVELIKSLKAKRVKIYDANPEILKALSNTNHVFEVSIMFPNQLILNVSSNQTLADEWVKTNMLPLYPQALIRYLLVGNEVTSASPPEVWAVLVPAIRRIDNSLKHFGIGEVKVGTPTVMDVMESSFPPSNGTFRSDIADRVMRPLLQFLDRTKSFFFLNVFPHGAWSSDPNIISLDYALFESKNITVTDPVTGLVYHNLLDQMLDSVHYAMKRLGYPNIPIFIAETGWPSGGDIDQIGANIHNAATYNRNFVKKVTTKPAVGTPARPGSILPSFIFALYNENQKPGVGTERHFGLLYPNGSRVYEIDLSGKIPESKYKPLPPAENNKPYKGKIWCVVGEGANETALSGALSYACSQGNKTCDAIQPGKPCSKPDSLVLRASYAFSSYWVQFRPSGGSCFFNGLANHTTKDPSYGSCKFPSVTLK